MQRSVMTNPFHYGDLALDEAFTDRRAELDDLTSDMQNGQNVAIIAPRRFGKSSLVKRAAQELLAESVLVAEVDLMKTPTKEKLAAKLSKTIHDDIATALFNVKERLRVFSTLRTARRASASRRRTTMRRSTRPSSACSSCRRNSRPSATGASSSSSTSFRR
jgi:ABC-type phosphate/phosphonate transport system ATPase subunit